jgi:hypothetical protein
MELFGIYQRVIVKHKYHKRSWYGDRRSNLQVFYCKSITDDLSLTNLCIGIGILLLSSRLIS